MRVLFLTHNYPRHHGDVSGAFLHPLAQGLVAQGATLQVIAPSDRGEVGDATLDDIPVRRVRYAVAARETLAYTGTMTGALRSIGGLRAFSGLLEAFRREVRDQLHKHPETVIHAHWWVPAAMSLPKGVRHVVTCHGTDVRLLDGSLPIRLIGQRVLRRATMVTTVSRSLARTIARLTGQALPDDQVQPMPVPMIDRPLSKGGGGIVVLGRLSAQKRIDLALDAYELARQRGVSLPLTIAGDGPARRQLESRARQRGIDEQVRFVGAISPAAVSALFADADLMLMPAQREGLGLAAAEALMQGVPVIVCNDGGGVLDVVSNGAGGRVVAATASAIADAIVGLLGDPAARDDAARAGLPWHDRLSPEQVATRCLNWYQRVLAA